MEQAWGKRYQAPFFRLHDLFNALEDTEVEVGLTEFEPPGVRPAVVDGVAEPHRRRFIPGFDAVREAGLGAGALGVGLSGSGPSMFALCRTATEARTVAAAMAEAFAEAGIEGADTHVSEVANTGAHMVETPA